MALFRNALSRILQQTRKVLFFQRPLHILDVAEMSHDEFENKFMCYFQREDIDGWDIRQAMTDLLSADLIPDPCTIRPVLYACRRVNDFALTVRFLEAVRDKCAGNNTTYAYIIQEIAPTLCELGIDPPECLGYDQPELFCRTVYEIHDE